MLSKRVLDALREEFHEEFGELSERDDYIQRMKADAFALIGSMAPNDRRTEREGRLHTAHEGRRLHTHWQHGPQ